MFKETLSPCYDNVQKKDGTEEKEKLKRKNLPLEKQQKKKLQQNQIEKLQENLRPNLKNKEEEEIFQLVKAQCQLGIIEERSKEGLLIYHMDGTNINLQELYLMEKYSQHLIMTNKIRGKIIQFIPKVGGGKVKMTIGKDGRKYF